MNLYNFKKQTQTILADIEKSLSSIKESLGRRDPEPEYSSISCPDKISTISTESNPWTSYTMIEFFDVFYHSLGGITELSCALYETIVCDEIELVEENSEERSFHSMLRRELQNSAHYIVKVKGRLESVLTQLTGKDKFEIVDADELVDEPIEVVFDQIHLQLLDIYTLATELEDHLCYENPKKDELGVDESK